MDLRIEKTYRLLMDAFTTLLEEEPYETISISKLCDKAMIRRTTFYKHFADKDEFFVFYIRTMHQMFRQRVEGTHEAQGAEVLNEFISFMEEHQSLVDNVINSKSSSILLEVLRDTLAADLVEELRKGTFASGPSSAHDAASEEALRLRAAFYAGGVVRMLQQWWQGGRSAEGRRAMLSIFEEARALL